MERKMKRRKIIMTTIIRVVPFPVNSIIVTNALQLWYQKLLLYSFGFFHPPWGEKSPPAEG
jgi:hypothetical protein